MNSLRNEKIAVKMLTLQASCLARLPSNSGGLLKKYSNREDGDASETVSVVMIDCTPNKSSFRAVNFKESMTNIKLILQDMLE